MNEIKHATECPDCAFSFDLERRLIQHLMNVHQWRADRISKWLEDVRGKDPEASNG